MKRIPESPTPWLLAGVLVLTLACPGFAQPATEDQEPMPVQVQNKSLIIEGKKVPLLCGEVHYWRLDPKYWRTVLERVKECGLTMVGTYVPWRVHEEKRGEFDFGESGKKNLDLAAFLALCQELDLYVFLRPGPLIVSEMRHGGLPDWLFEDPSILTHNSKGQVPKFGSFADAGNPSYMHPGYLEIAKTWLTKVNDVSRPFFLSNGGPIVMVQLDNEVSMICLDAYLTSDYNPVVIEKGGLFHQWLERKYGDIENVPYQDRPASITDIEPPREIPDATFENDLFRYMDWAEFKEDYMADYVAALARIERNDGLTREIFAVNYNPHRPIDTPNNWYKIEKAADNGITGFDYYKRPHMPWEQFQKTTLSARYSCAVTKLPWSPEWMCGIWGDTFGGDGQVGPKHTEFMYIVGLAYGLVGFNHYMFAERESWSFSAVSPFGQKRYNFLALELMTRLHKELDPATLAIDSRVGLVYDRKYAWLGYIEEGFPCRDDHVQIGKRTVDGVLNGQTTREMEGLFSLLLQLGHTPTILVPGINLEEGEKMKAVIIPCQTRMDAEALKALYAMGKKGVRLVFDPAPPTKAWDGSPLNVPVPAGVEIVSTSENLALQDLGKEKPEQREKLASFLGPVKPAATTGEFDVPVVLATRGDEKVLFVLNLNERAKEITLEVPFDCTALHDLKTDERLAVRDRKSTFPVDCKEARILKVVGAR